MEWHELYQPEELNETRAAKKRTGRAMLVVAMLGLIACVTLCCLATRQNRNLTFPLTVGASVLSGWAVIYLSHSRHEEHKARVRHVELMLTGPRERFTGTFTKLDGIYRVKRGVSIRKVRQQEEFHELLLTVWEQKAAQLPDSFEGTVETVYDCVVAYGEGVDQ